jgi:hypothetical protein
MSDQPEEDLAVELRSVFERVDAVPPLASQGARAALTWRRMDAELAELLADSADDAQSLATSRRSGTASRAMTFAAEQITIDLQIRNDADGRERTVLGQLSPPMSARIEVHLAAGEETAADADAEGRFKFVLPAETAIRLRISGDGLPAPIETSWITL